MEHNTAEEKLRPVPTQRASEAIYGQIKELILSGELKPGDRLPSERSLMERLQRSRPTIREALRMLEHAGFIRTVPGTNGAVICEPGVDEVEESLMTLLQTNRVTVGELSEYRLANETAVARWASERHTGNDAARLAQILDGAETLLRERRFEEFIDHDAAFHSTLAQAGGNSIAAFLAQVLSRLTEPKMLEAVRRQGEEENRDMCARILSMHREILDAVRAGDPDAAERAMAYHIKTFGADLSE